MKNYQEIVAKYPNSSEAREAVNNAKNVYIDLGTVDEYAVWVRGISFVNITDAELDNTTYESAENKFLANDVPKAIEGFKSEMMSTRSQLRSVKFDLRRDVESLKKWVISINVAILPLFFAGIALLISLRRKRKNSY